LAFAKIVGISFGSMASGSPSARLIKSVTCTWDREIAASQDAGGKRRRSPTNRDRCSPPVASRPARRVTFSIGASRADSAVERRSQVLRPSRVGHYRTRPLARFCSLTAPQVRTLRRVSSWISLLRENNRFGA
jgi:hypothetical protein